MTGKSMKKQIRQIGGKSKDYIIAGGNLDEKVIN